MVYSSAELIKSDISEKKHNVVAVCVCDKWNKFSLRTSEQVEAAKERISNNAVLHLVEKKDINDICDELNIMTTPAFIFYNKGKPMKIKKQGWQCDDYKVTGAYDVEDIVGFVRFALEACDNQKSILEL